MLSIHKIISRKSIGGQCVQEKKDKKRGKYKYNPHNMQKDKAPYAFL